MNIKRNVLSDFVQRNMPWVFLLIVVAFFSLTSPTFFDLRNFVNILNQNVYVIIASLGIAPIMMSGNIDLSVGYQMSLIGVLCGILFNSTDLPVGVVIVLALLLGVVLNVANTLLTLKLRLTRLMVTVGTMAIFQGISFVVTDSKTYGGFPDAFKFIGQGYIGSVPFPIILAAVLFLIMNFFMNRTYWGRYVYALGGNEEATRLAGIQVTAVKMMISVIAGLFVGLSAIMLISRLGSAQSGTGPGTEFTVITGILVGGVSIRGGEGKLSGVLAGILLMAVLANGMQMLGLGTYSQYIAKGVIMLFAIGFDVFQMERRKRAKIRK